MWVKATTRRELIDIVQNERQEENTGRLFSRFQFRAVSSLSSLGEQEELTLVWHDDPREVFTLPNLIVTGSDQREFLAWTLTYLKGLHPLTAYIRVAPYSVAQQALKLQNPPTLHRLESACAGLILGETATYVGGQHDLKRVTAKTCSGTFSFVMARSLALGSVTPDNIRPALGWFDARTLTNQQSTSLSQSVLLEPWYALLSLENHDGSWPPKETRLPRIIVDACLELYLKGEVDFRQSILMQSELSDLSEVAEAMRGPREDRVLALEHAIGRLRSRPTGNTVLSAFILGYVASLIAPGTMDHLPLLAPQLTEFPGVLMWYGLCAGLHRQSLVHSYSDGLGRRTIREVLRSESFLDRPNCDISLAELEVLSVKGKGPFQFRTSSNSQLDVEIAPCTTATLRWPPRAELPESYSAPKVEADDIEFVEHNLMEASDNIRRALGRLDHLSARRGKSGKEYRKSSKK